MNFMNEELVEAIDILRQRPTDQSWFIPVKLNECEIPDRDIGAGETLRDIHWIELDKDWDDGLQRIIKVIRPAIVKDEMVKIPAGEFQMGTDEQEIPELVKWGIQYDFYSDIEKNWFEREIPLHPVHLDEFYIDVYPVTNAQYRKFIEATGHSEPRYWNDKDFNQSKHPVVGVTWYDAMFYAEWAGKRLPTEAEWEKAARGGWEGKRHPEQPDDKRANYGEKIGTPTPVGSYNTNCYGLYDMVGNVWEWCLDEYQSEFYRESPRNNPLAGSADLPDLLINYKNINTSRVSRGGSWRDVSFNLRVARRVEYNLTNSINELGFRCVSPRLPQ
jgi:formylglycine-generating enzyme required for sulfatase activity